MGVDDSDIDKMMNCGISLGSINNLYGNSIVVDVLVEVFREMFFENRKRKYGQLF